MFNSTEIKDINSIRAEQTPSLGFLIVDRVVCLLFTVSLGVSDILRTDIRLMTIVSFRYWRSDCLSKTTDGLFSCSGEVKRSYPL